MDYGSSHVYMYDNSDDELISDEEFKEGMWLRWVSSGLGGVCSANDSVTV